MSYRVAVRGWLAASIGLLLTTAALAFPSSRFIYARGKGAEQCPSEETVRQEVASRLGYDPFFPWAERTIVTQIARGPKGLRATVQLVDAAGNVLGEREITSSKEDCEELLKSIALNISIAIDPESAERLPSPTVSVSESSPVPPSAPPDQPAAPVPPRLTPQPASSPTVDHPDATPLAVANPISLRAGVGAVSAIGATPTVSLGPLVSLGAGWRQFAAFLEASESWSLGATTDGVITRVLSVSLVPCVEQAVFFGCVIGTAGDFYARGDKNEHHLHANAGARIGMATSLSSFVSVRGYVDGIVPFAGTRFLLNGREVWRAPPVAGNLGVQVTMQF